LAYDEFDLTESAYRHGCGDEDFAEMLRNRHLILRNLRGRLVGYVILGATMRVSTSSRWDAWYNPPAGAYCVCST
jgi:hypothetical protein